MMELLKEEHAKEKLDFILITGDLIGHGLPQEVTDPYDESLYQLLKKTHVEVRDIISSAFQDVPLFYAFGNNDTKYHYSAPFQAEKEQFYSFIFDLWFKGHPANQKFVD
jgi:Icc-related predicted phosphoesterase